MKNHIFLLSTAIGLSLLTASSASAQSLTFSATPPKLRAGDTLTLKSLRSFHSEETTVIDGKAKPVIKSGNDVKENLHIVVKSVDSEGMPKQLLVHFQEKGEQTKVNDHKTAKKSSVSGKKYLVTYGSATHKVTDLKSKDVSPKVQALVLQAIPHLVEDPEIRHEQEFLEKDNEFRKLLTKQPLKIGQSFKLNKKQVAALFNAALLNDSDVSMTLSSQSTTQGLKTATFDTTISHGFETEDGQSMDLKITGKLIICLESCFILSTQLKGPTIVQSQQQRGQSKVLSRSKGQISISQAWTFKAAQATKASKATKKQAGKAKE